MEPLALPDEVAAACLRVARQFQLLFAGIDLKETPEGDYYCFEVNPSPGFLVYEQQSGQGISRALAQLLATAVRVATIILEIWFSVSLSYTLSIWRIRMTISRKTIYSRRKH